jgi:hypothetical protein
MEDPSTMASVTCCQGCGTPEGKPCISYRRKKRHDKPVKLTATTLADYGEQLLCDECRQAAIQLNYQLTMNHLTLSC